MNTFDKHYLFRLSDALKRRFAFVEILPPRWDEAEAEKEKYYMFARALNDIPESALAEKIVVDGKNKVIIRSKSDKNFLALLDSMYEIMAFIRQTKNLGTAILIAMTRFIMVHSASNIDFDNSLDIALKSNALPQLENVSKWSIEAISAFACDDIAKFFRQVNPNSIDFSKYEAEFAKFLQYKKVSDMPEIVEKYRKKQLTDAEWTSFNPWTGKWKPKLPLFQRSLMELAEETQLL